MTVATRVPTTPTPAPARFWSQRGARSHRLVLAVSLAALFGVAALSASIVDSDSGSDSAALAGRVANDCAHLRWQFTLIVMSIGALHYAVSGVAARAAAGIQVTLREVTQVQLAAAAANRLTPAGLGGSAINVRYFMRRGLDAPESVGAVAVLNVVGAVADLLAFALLVLAGRVLGLGGGRGELTALWKKLAKLVAPLTSTWIWVAVPVAALAALGFHYWARRSEGRSERWRAIATPIARIAHDPRRLCTLTLASGATTLLLAVAFAASVAMVPGSAPHISTGALLVAFMAGSAAGNAIPLPAGLGSTELAFSGILVAAVVPATRAVEIVLIFRLITFWLPAAFGILAVRGLHRRSAL